ncbi:unnamed protein product [Dovyalis caffra]|uniref:Uncharacterized protein n=1 Tax=Dovyalis caffra TaxID=77055 RepID=A0AAV1RP40_9ROSI|nr:unnamed protein product [Dovyalis caffra]
MGSSDLQYNNIKSDTTSTLNQDFLKDEVVGTFVILDSRLAFPPQLMQGQNPLDAKKPHTSYVSRVQISHNNLYLQIKAMTREIGSTTSNIAEPIANKQEATRICINIEDEDNLGNGHGLQKVYMGGQTGAMQK